MIQVRRAGERGHAEHGWLESFHTFSFADYHDPRHMGFRSLRVVNEDRVQPGRGFGTHGHADMEIVSYVLEGALAHRDSLGTGSIIRPGEVQRMSAGSGVQHSEFNASQTDLVHFLQIWILPDRRGIAPSYEQRAFSTEERRNRWRLVVSPDGRDGSLTIHQDASMRATLLDDGVSLRHDLAPGRHAWIQLARGAADVNGVALVEGDGVALSDVSRVELVARSDLEALLFDLA
jgi:redox-sensitive bicupin YhaK (pirin superfamily)